MDLHADDESSDQDTVIDRPLRSDMLANRLDDHRLDLGCRHASHRSGAPGRAVEQSLLRPDETASGTRKKSRD